MQSDKTDHPRYPNSRARTGINICAISTRCLRAPAIAAAWLGVALAVYVSPAAATTPGCSGWVVNDGSISGGDLGVYALAASGGRVYAGGSFSGAGSSSANNVALWDGTTWSALGSGTDGKVYALATNGSRLYVGGSFSTAGGVSAGDIAQWDGADWSALGDGIDGIVDALAVDSNGNLYAGGTFTVAGSVSASNVARWDGSSWSALGSGTDGTVFALAVDGNGQLYAGGIFSTAGGVSASNIAKWDGSSWSALGSGTDGLVLALVVDSVNSVDAGGTFSSAGGVSASNVAKWGGSSWSALDSGTNGEVDALAVDGTTVYAGGQFTTAGGVAARITKWDGTSWISLLNETSNDLVLALTFDTSSNLYAGGQVDFDPSTSALFREYTACCGNGILDPGEDCDDGNNIDGDGCPASCRFPTSTPTLTPTMTPTPLPADLTVVKTNDVGGTVTLGGSWTWTLHVANNGSGAAIFNDDQQIVQDDLPQGITYADPTTANFVGINSSDVLCYLNPDFSVGGTLFCYTFNAHGVQIPPGASFDVSIVATPNSTGTFVNPDAAGTCHVDFGQVITESDETNNSCTDTVIVTGSASTSTPTETPTSTPTETPTSTPTMTPTSASDLCPLQPLAACKPISNDHAVELMIRNDPLDSRDRVSWVMHFGDRDLVPQTLPDPATTSYSLCVYFDRGAGAQLYQELTAPAGALCNGKPCWKRSRRGIHYADPNGLSGGLRGLLLSPGGPDWHAVAKVWGRGANLELQPIPSDIQAVVMQLMGLPKGNSQPSECWSATATAPLLKNDPRRLRAQSD